MTEDARADEARKHHVAAGRDEDSARKHRQSRDALVRALRAEDPQRWTYPALAAAVGCSPELIAAIVKRNTRS